MTYCCYSEESVTSVQILKYWYDNTLDAEFLATAVQTLFNLPDRKYQIKELYSEIKTQCGKFSKQTWNTLKLFCKKIQLFKLHKAEKRISIAKQQYIEYFRQIREKIIGQLEAQIDALEKGHYPLRGKKGIVICPPSMYRTSAEYRAMERLNTEDVLQGFLMTYERMISFYITEKEELLFEYRYSQLQERVQRLLRVQAEKIARESAQKEQTMEKTTPKTPTHKRPRGEGIIIVRMNTLPEGERIHLVRNCENPLIGFLCNKTPVLPLSVHPKPNDMFFDILSTDNKDRIPMIITEEIEA